MNCLLCKQEANGTYSLTTLTHSMCMSIEQAMKQQPWNIKCIRVQSRQQHARNVKYLSTIYILIYNLVWLCEISIGFYVIHCKYNWWLTAMTVSAMTSRAALMCFVRHSGNDKGNEQPSTSKGYGWRDEWERGKERCGRWRETVESFSLKHFNSTQFTHTIVCSNVIFIKVCILGKGHAPMCKQFDE